MIKALHDIYHVLILIDIEVGLIAGLIIGRTIRGK